MFKDAGSCAIATTFNLSESDLFDAASNCVQDSSTCSDSGGETSSSAAATALENANGCYITLGTNEKVMGNFVTLNNVTFFNTNQPSTQSSGCDSDLGTACQYRVNFDDATAIADVNLSGDETAADRSEPHAGGGYCTGSSG